MKKASQTGLAMVIVIWVLTLLTIMAGSFALSMRRETTVISAVKDNAVALAWAEAGIAIAEKMLMQEDENNRWRADGSIYQIHYQNTEIRVKLLSEYGKIDINKADEVSLTNMMQSLPIDLDKQQALVGAIIDWRDQDELVHINGAEKLQYQDAGLNYQPANKNFQLIDELKMVLGMNSAIFQKLQPLITVYSGQAQVNLQAASKEVLQVVAQLDPAMLDEYIYLRTESNQIKTPPPEFPLMDNGEKKSASSKNGIYTFIAQARINGELGGGIKKTIKQEPNARQQEPSQVLEWDSVYQKLSLFSEEMEQRLVKDESEFEH